MGNAWACGAVVGEGGGTRKYSQVSASLRCRESFPAVATAEIAIRASNATAALSNGTAAIQSTSPVRGHHKSAAKVHRFALEPALLLAHITMGVALGGALWCRATIYVR